MKIKMKILLPVTTAILISVIAVLTTVSLIFSDYVDTAAEKDVIRFSDAAMSEFDGLSQQAENSSTMIAANLDFAAAVANKDPDATLALSQFFDQHMNIEFITVSDEAGNVLARSHEPEKYGDSVIGQENIKQALSGKVFTTLEGGTAVKLSVRSGAPIYYEDQLVGAVSTGYRLDTDSFVDRIHAITGAEATIFLKDERLSTTIVNEDGNRAVGTKASENISAQVLAGNDYEGYAEILGRDAFVKYVPIKATGGEVMGMLFVGQFSALEAAAMQSFLFLSGGIALFLLILSAIVMWLLTNRITTPLRAMVNAADRLANGETDVRVVVNTKDELRDLANTFERMIENSSQQARTIEAIAAGDLTSTVMLRSEKDVVGRALQEMLRANNETFAEINEAANQVSAEAEQISSGAQTLAQGSTEQAGVVQELSASISTLAAHAKENADITEKATALEHQIRSNAENGSQQMAQLTQAVTDITDASRAIASVIKVIDDIAFQTNILALNAAVEAARAGQHGKGFAVVADEVRNLAGKSAEAAKETSQLITNSIEKAELGSQIAEQTASSFAEIMNGINENSKLMGEIAASSSDSRVAIDQINVGIEQVANVVQQNSASSEESAAASEELSGQSQILKQLVGRFQIKASGHRRPALAPSFAPHDQLPDRSQEPAYAFSENNDKYGKY